MYFKLLSITTILAAFFITGCGSSSSSTQSYSCSLPCLQVTPVISTTSISTATGGTVDVTLEFSGSITDIARVDIFLRDTNSGTNAGTSVTFSPATQTLTETITVNSGTPVGSYYPYVIIYTTASNTSSRYYRDISLSASQYAYYEINNDSASQLMNSAFVIPMLLVN